MYLLLFIIGCTTPKQTQPPPEAKSTEQKSAPVEKQGVGDLQVCVSRCVKERQMEARAAEAIEADCRASCSGEAAPFPGGATP